MRVAIVHDWLYTIGGAEKVLAGMLSCFPDADVFCLFDTLSIEDRQRLGLAATRTSFMQRFSITRRRHRLFLPLMPLAIEQFDMSGYDVVISSSFAVANGVITGPNQVHLSYVHSPMRYAWDQQHAYLRESKMTHGLRGLLARLLLHRIRLWDVRTAHGVDGYMANSHFVARRVRKTYGRLAEVIYPPVSVPRTLISCVKENYFLAASRLVPYKNTRAIIEAFNVLPNERLVVAGDGPEAEQLRRIAGPNVSFVGFVEDGELRRLMRHASAFLFAAEEDFGIVPVEAQGEGTPVICLGRGGVVETVRTDCPAPTGLFFDRPEASAIADAVRRFRLQEASFLPTNCHRNALRFASSLFAESFGGFVHRHVAAFNDERDAHRASAYDLGCATIACGLEYAPASEPQAGRNHLPAPPVDRTITKHDQNCAIELTS